MHLLHSVFIGATALLLASACVHSATSGENAKEPPSRAKLDGASTDALDRHVIVISDLHMGLGRDSKGEWLKSEDFRWADELSAFLDEVSARGDDKTDLVIAGDLLELWQPPSHIKCTGYDEDHGCTIKEMEKVVSAVVKAHETELKALRAFSLRGQNRVHVIPGNHDSSLLLESVWDKVAEKLVTDKKRINLVEDGRWISNNRQVVVEHGHQIGKDVNRYEAWPNIVSRAKDGLYYIERPWGERFVQKEFNAIEDMYPIVDNIGPESASIRFRMADRGLFGSISDIVDFISFNLFETNLAQFASFLGSSEGKSLETTPKWDEDYARGKGEYLFLDALAEDDPFLRRVNEDNAKAEAVRKGLAALAVDEKRLPSDHVMSLCDMIAIRGRSQCNRHEMGYQLQKLLVSTDAVIREHLARDIYNGLGEMGVFIYGHTHELTIPRELSISSSRHVVTANSGAFQRVVDEAGYLRRLSEKSLELERKIDVGEGLSVLTLEELPPCYTFVEVDYKNSQQSVKTLRWYMPDKATRGKVIDAADKNDKSCM